MIKSIISVSDWVTNNKENISLIHIMMFKSFLIVQLYEVIKKNHEFVCLLLKTIALL